VAGYEAPLIADRSRPTTAEDWTRIREAIAAGRRGAAVQLFLRSVGVPAPVLAVMRLLPLWSKLKAIAHTLPYDGAIIEPHQHGTPPQRAEWSAVTIPALVVAGGSSPDWMRNGNRALADALPNGRYETLPGQTHNLRPAAHVGILTEFGRGAAEPR
jgi:pimeloyl-ACP methyl ester carboxylesterase